MMFMAFVLPLGRSTVVKATRGPKIRRNAGTAKAFAKE